MACGERYSHLLTVGGNPADLPCGLLSAVNGCATSDATAWNQRADEVWYMVRASWNRLMDLENERQDWTHSRALRAQVDEFERASEAMVRWSWTTIAFNTTVVNSSIAVIRSGICALDRLNAAIEQLQPGGAVEPGSSSPTRPSLLPGLPEMGGGLMILAAAAAVLFLWNNR